MSKTQRSDAEIIRIIKEAENGVLVQELCRTHGMCRATIYKWRSRYGGCDESIISEMKSLAEENRCLKRMYADVQLQNDLLRDLLSKNKQTIFEERMCKDGPRKKICEYKTRLQNMHD